MMSDSDDTDVLLVIPPDLFVIRSSSSETDSVVSGRLGTSCARKTGVISELVGHMQALDSRLCAIESRDSSLDATVLNNSLDSQIRTGAVRRSRETLPRTRFSVSQSSSLHNTPVKPRQSLSVPSTPSGCCWSLNRADLLQNDRQLGHRFPLVSETNNTNTRDRMSDKHDPLTSHSDSAVVSYASHCKGLPHATVVSSAREQYSFDQTERSRHFNTHPIRTNDQPHLAMPTSVLPSVIGQQSRSKTVQDMELSEVDELLQEMEVTEIELSKRINNASSYLYLKDHSNTQASVQTSDTLRSEEPDIFQKYSVSRRLDFPSTSSKLHYPDGPTNMYHKRNTDTFPDLSLLSNESNQVDETERMISEFRIWDRSKVDGPKVLKPSDELLRKLRVKASDVKTQDNVQDRSSLNTNDTNTASIQPIPNLQSHPLLKTSDNTLLSKQVEQGALNFAELYANACQNNNAHPKEENDAAIAAKCHAEASTNTDFPARVFQGLLSLSDIWESNTNKSKEEMLRIKLEEEKFRREHCEHLIQELQKRLLEQQEKVAVALRVDNEKNELLTRFHGVCAKLKQRVNALESEQASLEGSLKSIMEKHQAEITEYQAQIKRSEGELSKALDLAAGYKEKSDELMKQKVELLKSHADELESYKLLVQEAERGCQEAKGEHNKLLEKHQQTEEALRNLQQELGKERLRGGEVRNEMNVIHKALDTCEAELTILRQEKESLQLKLKEEVNRNAILEQKNLSLLASIDDAKKAEKLAKDETKSLADQKEQIRAELQEVYQKQVDEVVKAKLQEFQTQLDAAEAEFVEELKTRQQVIAECAARKIKEVMDKHRLEINLLEEKHKEEKRLCELQLAQAVQKSTILETQLNSQRTAKSQLAEQLHSVMQTQWQQALQIISGGNTENLTPLQRIHAEKLLESKAPRKSESIPNRYSKIAQEPMRLAVQDGEGKTFYGMVSREQLNENRGTVTPIDETPLTSRKESKDDLRKYIRMIAEMQQQKEDFPKVRESAPSPPPICREVPRKHYTKKELSVMSEDSITWQPVSEVSAQDISEFIPVSQKVSKVDQSKGKPPWK